MINKQRTDNKNLGGSYVGPEIEASSEVKEHAGEEPRVLEEIAVEELSIDGICGVY